MWKNTNPPQYNATTTNGESYTFYTGEPGGAWASNLNFDPKIDQKQARPVKPDGPYQIGELDLKRSEFEKLKAYALSVAVQSHLTAQRFGDSKFPLFVSSEEQKELNTLKIETPPNYLPYSIEDLWREATRLNFSEKAHQTLLNLTLLEETPGTEIRIAVNLDSSKELEPPQYHLDPKMRVESPKGLVFGAVEGERLVVLIHLVEEGLITLGREFRYLGGNPVMTQIAGCKTIRITPKGYILAEKITTGDASVTRRAFLVCPAKASYRALYDATCIKVGNHPEVRCEIKPAWADPHVEKIDDRIFRLIREATIVVVDLDLNNFNVALEAGYALALGKPIVWTRKLPWRKQNPFDIYSHNMLKWSEAEPEKFEEDLKNQVLAAFDKARSGR